MKVQPFSATSVRPGKTATYAIWVWTTVAAASDVKVTAAVARLAHVNAAKFTVCPVAKGAVCAVGDLPTGQADELKATVLVGRAAAAGKKVKLTATASGKNATSFHASASILISATATSSPTPTPTASIPSIPGLPVPTLPGTGTLPGVGATNPANLFPTVTPGAGTPTPASGSAGTRPHRANAVPASATLPLDPRLIGGQLAGLAVLAGAIVIAIARLSLRAPKQQGSRPAGD